MITLKLPYLFIRPRTDLSWPEVRFGLERGYIEPEVAVRFAADRVRRDTASSADEVGLAAAQTSDSIEKTVRHLASREASPEPGAIEAKWLFLLLDWVYENRHLFPDPLGVVEELYADFDYPEEVAKFVRYMPMVGKPLGSTELAVARLYDYWAQYVADARHKFAAST